MVDCPIFPVLSTWVGPQIRILEVDINPACFPMSTIVGIHKRPFDDVPHEDLIAE